LLKKTWLIKNRKSWFNRCSTLNSNDDNSSLWVSQSTENAHPNRLEYIPKIDWGDENPMGNMDNRWEWLNGFTILYIRLHYRTNVLMTPIMTLVP
jgi:hypothetical protein